jgi:hypothetical protein
MRQFDQGRLSELVLYIARKGAGDRRLGKTKLVKLLAYADFEAYARLGDSITGDVYQKLEHGPAPRDLPGTIAMLELDGDLVEEPASFWGRTQKRYAAKRDAAVNRFSAEELALVDEIIARFWDMNAREISDASHRDFAGWDMVDHYEDIPYRTALISGDVPSEETLTKGREAVARLRHQA